MDNDLVEWFTSTFDESLRRELDLIPMSEKLAVMNGEKITHISQAAHQAILEVQDYILASDNYKLRKALLKCQKLVNH